MRLFAPMLSLCVTLAAPALFAHDEPASLHDFTVKTLQGKPRKLSAYSGKVLLVVNTASECGYTPQYEGLQKLYDAEKSKGFVILGFPSNDFGGQEPGDAKQIAKFCKLHYAVTFPMFAKVRTKGKNKAPVYAFLSRTHGEPKWNFHKYLVGKDGKVLRAFSSSVTPEDAELKKAIAAALEAK